MNIDIPMNGESSAAQAPLRQGGSSTLTRFRRIGSPGNERRLVPLLFRRRTPLATTRRRERSGAEAEAHALGEQFHAEQATGARRPPPGSTATVAVTAASGPKASGRGAACRRPRTGIERVHSGLYSGRGWASAMMRTVVVAFGVGGGGGGGVGGPVAVAEAASSGTTGGYLMPLTKRGQQYLADVSVYASDEDVTGNLVIDTTISLLAFRQCNSTSIASSSPGTCFVDADPPHWSDIIWNCEDREMDNGRVFLSSSAILGNPKYATGRVTFPTAEKDGEVMEAIDGDVYVASDIFGASDSTLAAWNNSDGVFGLALYPDSACLGSSDSVGESHQSVFGKVFGEPGNLSVFALNLGGEDDESTLEIGGYSELEDLEWGETYPQDRASLWSFPAFDVRVCGKSLLSNGSSSWPAKVSTGSACLGLPRELFDSLKAWAVNGRCVDVTMTDRSDTKEVCYTNSTQGELPWLSFRLSEWGPPFYIPLTSLLIDDPDDPNARWGEKRLCVTREATIDGGEKDTFNFDSFIVLGTLALQSLYVVVDVNAPRVGLAQKGAAANGSALRESGEESCIAPQVCNGSQVFQEALNTCDLPPCDRHFFYHLDEETMTCRTPKSLATLAWVVGIGFGVIEIVGHFLRAYYGGTGIALRGHGQNQGWEFNTGRLLDTCLSKVPWAGSAGARGNSGVHPRND